MSERVARVWGRIEAWLGANLPAALEGLDGPAGAGQIQELERLIGFELAEDVRAIYRTHDGDRGLPGRQPRRR